PCQVRIIEVPPAIHGRFPNAEALPLFQMIAKNVGIRRARGRFVLATNIDILFSDELMHFLKGGGLRPGKMYRIDRTDVDAGVPVDAPVEQQLAYCRGRQIRLSCRYGHYLLDPTGCIAPEADDIVGDGVALKMGFYPVAHDFTGRTYRWCGEEAVIVVRPGAEPAPCRLCVELEPGPCLKRVPFLMRVEDGRGGLVGEGFVGSHGIVSVPVTCRPNVETALRFRPLSERRPRRDDYRSLDLRVYRVGLAPGDGDPFRFDPLRQGAVWRNAVRAVGRAVRRLWDRRFMPCGMHVGACGDFTLMAREDWLDLRGYPEFPVYSLNLDTLLCWQAIYAGIEEVVLEPPMRAYHIDHSSGATPEGEKELLERVATRGIPVMSAAQLYEHVRRVARNPRGHPFNGDDWGMRDLPLLETRVGTTGSGMVA
ncbi:MAG TPA: hypothetical protein VFW33_19580, partial [Gemmataceae bacterium]|nr:hypothetical protein [Gemmataceae bacterium]